MSKCDPEGGKPMSKCDSKENKNKNNEQMRYQKEYKRKKITRAIYRRFQTVKRNSYVRLKTTLKSNKFTFKFTKYLYYVDSSMRYT